MLIVTSMYLPHLAADSHRARILARELPKQGWEVELLVPGDAFHSVEFLDPFSDLLQIPAPVHRAIPEWSALFRMMNSRTLGWRAFRPLRNLGNSLLATGRFDLVYISCSQSNLFYLGVGWRRQFRVPFIVDLHDPWYSPLLGHVKHLPNWKRQIGNAVARYLEKATLRRASGIVSVSSQYLEVLNERYAGHSWSSLNPRCQAVIPFGPAEEDFRAASRLPESRWGDGKATARTIVYTGAGGPIMESAFRELCRLLAGTRRRAPKLLADVKIHLFGTEPGAAVPTPVLSRVSAEEGVSDLVVEFPVRISYLEALRRVQDADGLLVLGVADPAYSPSKLFLYALSGKPMLACMIAGTTVRSYFDALPEMGRLVQFDPASEASGPEASGALEAFLEDVAGRRNRERSAMLKEYLAPEMARRHVELFDECLGARSANHRALGSS